MCKDIHQFRTSLIPQYLIEIEGFRWRNDEEHIGDGIDDQAKIERSINNKERMIYVIFY